jgi:hypothetical protein
MLCVRAVRLVFALLAPRYMMFLSSRQRRRQSVTMQEPVACAKYIAISKFGASFIMLTCPPFVPSAKNAWRTARGSRSLICSIARRVSSRSVFPALGRHFTQLCYQHVVRQRHHAALHILLHKVFQTRIVFWIRPSSSGPNLGHPPGAAVDLAHRLSARPGPPRQQRELDEQGDLLRGDRPRRRPLAADPGRYGHHPRHGGRAHLPRHAGVPDLRRAERGRWALGARIVGRKM